MNKSMDKLKHFRIKSDAVFAIVVVSILMLLFIPVPAFILDILIVLNISLALLVLLQTFYSERPLDFSAFPSILLLATLFRLGLNISSTRLILAEGNAGQVITSVGNYVVAGNYIIGLVVFFILVVVQFVVVTNGAQRVAEVAARFILDSMPGKQMSIDADLNMGIIDETQAQKRREFIEKEANFYGAMDGATKFVKGDAIAGIIIILINIFGGLAIGVAQAGLPWKEALHIYTLQTVGDGLVTQIPSLIIAVGTGIIITRAATQGNLSEQLVTQFTMHPFTLYLVAFAVGIAAFLPGLPTITLILVACAFAAAGYFSAQKQLVKSNIDVEEELIQDEQNTVMDIGFSTELWDEIDQPMKNEINTQFDRFKQSFEKKYGLILPSHKLSMLTDLSGFEYSIRVHNIELSSGSLYPNHTMVIDAEGKVDEEKGIKGTEPAYGLTAVWLLPELAEMYKKKGMTTVESTTVLVTHFTEFVKQQAIEFVTRDFVDQVIAEQRKKNENLVNEVIPEQLANADLQHIIANLIQERVAIHNISQIFEVLADKARIDKNIYSLTEAVRKRMRNQIVSLLLDENRTLNIISLAPLLERSLLSGASEQQEHGLDKMLPIAPSLLEDIITQLSPLIERSIATKVEPVLLVNPFIRRSMWLTLNRMLPQLHVLSVDEVPTHAKLNSLGLIQSNTSKAA
jgi:flagellar biosynthesis protein FlhA